MDHHFPQNSFRILALDDEKRSQHMIFQFSSMGNLWIASWWDLPNKILSMRPGFFSTAVGAAYALFNAFEFSRKISLNVIWKILKNDGSRINFVVRNFLCILLLQRQQTFGRLKAYKNKIMARFRHLLAILTTKELNLKYKVNYGSWNILKSPLCEICNKVNLKTQNFGIVTLWG